MTKRRRTRTGYNIDVSALENLSVGTNIRTSGNHSFFADLIRNFFERCDSQGNPRSSIEHRETAVLQDELDGVLKAWLVGALDRLPKNQEACIFLRYRFDLKSSDDSESHTLRTQAEVAEIVGISQTTVHRNILRGIRNLKKDYDVNAATKVKEIKRKIIGE